MNRYFKCFSVVAMLCVSAFLIAAEKPVSTTIKQTSPDGIIREYIYDPVTKEWRLVSTVMPPVPPAPKKWIVMINEQFDKLYDAAKNGFNNSKEFCKQQIKEHPKRSAVVAVVGIAACAGAYVYIFKRPQMRAWWNSNNTPPAPQGPPNNGDGNNNAAGNNQAAGNNAAGAPPARLPHHVHDNDPIQPQLPANQMHQYTNEQLHTPLVNPSLSVNSSNRDKPSECCVCLNERLITVFDRLFRRPFNCDHYNFCDTCITNPNIHTCPTCRAPKIFDASHPGPVRPPAFAPQPAQNVSAAQSPASPSGSANDLD